MALERPHRIFWDRLRLALGMLQMAGATTSLVLLFLVGVTPLTLSFVVSTSVLTTASVLLFGRRGRLRDDDRREGKWGS